MKHFLLVLLMAAPFLANAQANYIQIGANNSDTTTERYVTFSPTNTQGNRRVIEKIRDSSFWSLRTLRAFIRPLDSTKVSVNNPSNVVWVSPFGELRRADVKSIILDTASLYASKGWILSRGFLTSFTQQNSDWNASAGVTQILNKPDLSQYYLASNPAGYITASNNNTYSAGYGISKTGTEPSATFSIDLADVMTVDRASDSIESINTKVNGKANASTTITINGITQNLAANRTWSVGDITSSGSYSNPGWIASLSYSKITGAPTVPAAQVNSDWNSTSGVTQILNKPSIPTNTGQITESGNLYFTEARSRNSISAGAGIAYNNTTGIISNSAPDQPVAITAGRGISVTGTYPNFTISLVAPTSNVVSRPLNTNFTPNVTKEVFATYSITCTVTNPLLVGTSSAMAYLEYSINGGTTWLLPSQNGNSSGVGVTVTVQLTNSQTGTLSGYIPANALARIRTAVSGSATVSYVTGQETFY